MTSKHAINCTANRRVHSSAFLALQSLGMTVRREDFSGARTALSACFRRIGAFARTKLSALLWLRRRRAVPFCGNSDSCQFVRFVSPF